MTLLEIMIVTVITGIIAAIGTPSLMAMLQGDQVKQGLNQIQLALQDAQKQAIRNSKKCTIKIEKKSGDDYFSLDIDRDDPDEDNDGCLGGVDRELPESVEVVMNGNQLQGGVTFSFKGTTTEKGTLVVRPTKGQGVQRCLVISDGLGIMRTGIYDANAANNTIDANYCEKLTPN
ncbi:type II secretion system protein [Crocosphaera sp.]|uniref:pilus assembly FimT family protein n=1 Tax=Crocosphaera sp. TaxID=2729996 RepID=UPI00262C0D83|nr:type II secretion system protein [Crocosphaera sp.]MDJ0578713.1 type II secretion system protein [Crocosphaera sp.]